MKFLIKCAPRDVELTVGMVERLEGEGVRVSGVELQLLRESSPRGVAAAFDTLREHGLVVGFHPPMPAYSREVLSWANVINLLKPEYVVHHAGSRAGPCSLREELRRVSDTLTAPFFFENLPFRAADDFRILSPSEAALLGDVLLDISHLFWSHRHGAISDPFTELERVSCIRAVHVAEPRGKDGVPIEEGSPELRRMLNVLFTRFPDAYYIGEPAGGHLNGGAGHYRNAIGFWRLWEEFRDGTLI